MNIDGIEYVKKTEAIKAEIVTLDADLSIANRMVGRFVLVRSRNEGINAGTVVCADGTGVELSNARRIWYHKPKDLKLPWYEGVAVSGLDSSSKISGTVETKLIIENYSMTLCTETAMKSIMAMAPHAGS